MQKILFLILVLFNLTNIQALNIYVESGGSGSGDVVGAASSTDDDIVTFDGTTGKLIQDSGVNISSLQTLISNTSGTNTGDQTLYGNISITIDGGGSAITTGVKGYVRVPYAGTITKVTVLADQSGSIVVDVWKDTYANYPPTVADTITASAKPTLSTATKAEDSTLTGWTKTITAGDVIGINVDSATTVTRVQILIEVTKS